MDMAEEEKKKSFWETLPGIITAITGLLGGVATVITALNSWKPPPSPPPDGPKLGDTITNDATGMKLAYVPGGCFMMGSSADDKDHQDDESPVHKVCVGSFWMGQYEVT